MPHTEMSKSGKMQIPGGPRRRTWLHRLIAWVRTLTKHRGAPK